METGSPIEFANVSLLEDPLTGTISDSLGHFVIPELPLGYVNLKVSFVGYQPYVYRDILLSSAREAVVEIPLKEVSQSVGEVMVRPQINKERAIKPMALAEGRLLSVEEANRFPGAFNDPARLVTSFAGVTGTGGISSNALSIRGNAPQYTQWRLEGVEIPNPTHFADMISLGGGVYSALSSQVMGNSDFFNGTFPAEYNNALSGVLDMQMRNGNTRKYQNTFQVSLMGLDLASEGPLTRNRNSSYLFNYRYSVTGLVADADLKYQDVSFKLNLPTLRMGTFSFWGLGLSDKNDVGALDQEDWETYDDRQDVKTTLNKTCSGLTHRYNIDRNAYVKTVLAATYSGIRQKVGQIDSLDNHTPVVDISNKNWNIVFNSFINHKLSPGHVNRTGLSFTDMIYDLDFYSVMDTTTNQPGNEKLNLAKAHHFNLAYDYHISDVLHLKFETYYQSLFDVPVEANTSFSVVNLNEYFLDKVLVNKGKGENYGVDFTLEHYLDKGTYYLLTGSVFRSRYKGGDGVWRSTRYDRGYSFNGVWGKEWAARRESNNRWGLNLRLTCQGGEKYTPVNEELSTINREITLDDSKAFSKQYNPFISGDITISYWINKKRVAHEIALKGLNIGFYTGESGYYYNESTQMIEKGTVLGSLWDISYKIHF